MYTAHYLGYNADFDIVENEVKILGEAVREGRVGEFAQIENPLYVNLLSDVVE